MTSCSRLLLLGLLLGVSASLSASNHLISVPGQEWKIAVDLPEMTVLTENGDGQGPVFSATGENSNLTVFVEEARGPSGANKACYQFYWDRARENPLIKPETVRLSLARFYYRVEYLVSVATAHGAFEQKNVNYFFAHNGRWVDVHLSVDSTSPRQDAILAAFDKGLRLEEATTKSAPSSPAKPVAPASLAPAVKTLRFAAGEAVTLRLSPHWQMSPATGPSGQFPFLTFPFRPANGGNASMLVTVYGRAPDPRKLDDAFLRKLLIGDSTPWIANTVDGKMTEIFPITFAHGRGVYANFVDAGLIGKPPVKDDFKISTCFILCLDGCYLAKISVLSDDLASLEFREAFAMIKTLAAATGSESHP